MKFFVFSLVTFTHLFCFNTLLIPEASAQLSGKWINSQKDARLLEITIYEENDGFFVEANGTCEGCNFGRVEASSVVKASQGGDQILGAVYQLSGKEIHLSAKRNGDKLEVRLSELVDHEDEKQSHNYLYSFLRSKKENVNGNVRIHSGSISGSVIGKAKSTAGIFQISLYGPDNGNRYITTHYFSLAKEYSFKNLPDGTYFVTVESKGSTGIEAFPEFAKIIVIDGKTYHHNVELR